MPTNELLEAKYRVQRVLGEQAGDDLTHYAAHIHRIVQDAARKYGLTLRYSSSPTDNAPRQTAPSKDASAAPSGTPA